MFDKGFDEPNYNIGNDYSGDYGDYDDSPQGIDKKKIIQFGIIGVVILVILGIAFVILTSQQTINFQIMELDGTSVIESLVILNENGENVYSGRESLHIVTLPPGTYTYRVNSLNYKPINRTLIIDESQENQSNIVIELEKDIDVKIEPLIEYDKIYFGQELTGQLVITNLKNSQLQNLEIISTSNVFDIVLNPRSVTISSLGSTSIEFTIKVKSNQQITSSKKERISFRAKGTSQSASFEIEVMPSIKTSDLGIRGTSIRGTNLVDNSLNAGVNKQLTITLQNNNRNISVENILVELTAEPGDEDKLSWFSFLGHELNNPNKFLISKLDDTSTSRTTNQTNINLNIRPPISEQIDSEFRGRIKISSLGIESDIIINVSVKVNKAAEINLEFNGTSNFISNCRRGEGCSSVITFNNTGLRNKGNFEIENINLFLVDQPLSDFDCFNWINFRTSQIPSIKPNETVNFIWDITPNEFREKQNTRCVIGWRYDDPINFGEIITGQQVIQIVVNVSG